MAEPANRHTNAAGGKYYIHPVTGEQFDSVTTILELFDKGALKIWSAGLAADMAFEHLPQLLGSILNPECGNTYNRCYQKHGRDGRCERCPCGECQPCWHRRLKWKHSAESARRSDEGTEFHEAANLWIVGAGALPTVRKEVQPYVDTFLQWVQDYGLTPNNTGLGAGSWEQTECTLLNRALMYAGTSDAAVWIQRGTPKANALLDRLRLDRALVRVDYKTREKPDEALYYDMPLQGVAYEACSVAMLPDGTEIAAPKTDARVLLQLRPGDYSFVPMLTNRGALDAFVGLLIAYRWVTGEGKKWFDPALDVTQHPTADGPPQTGRFSEHLGQTTAKVVELPELGGGAQTKKWVDLPELEPEQPDDPAKPDPFEAHNHPAQVQADAGGGIDRPPTDLEKLLGVDPGKLVASRLSEPLPF